MKNCYSILTFLIFSIHLFGQGETCSTAEIVTINNSFNADGPSTGMGCFNCSSNAVNADWYSFTVSETGFATVTSCEDQNGPDTRFWAYSGDCNNLSLIAQGDDGCGVGTNFSSIAEFPVEPGITYYIEWDDNWESDPFNWRLLFNVCPGITDPIIDFTTVDAAQISWSSSIPTNEATIEYGIAGFALGTGTFQNSTNATVNITGLSIDTDYQAYIFETCPDSSLSNLLGPINFSTDSLPAPANDLCSGAISISCGATINGSTEFANVSLNGENCGTIIDSPGIWYSITGDGSLLEASTCDSADFDTKISVFSGSCDSLNCIGGVDDSFPCENNTSTFSWQSNAGEEYFILVHGFGGSIGEFNLTLSCILCPEPSLVVTDVSDSQATVDWSPATPGTDFILEYGLGGFIPGNGTTFTGTTGIDGPPYVISGLNPITNYSVYILQDCGSDGASDTSSVLNFTTGDTPPMNDICTNAIELECDTIVGGITTFASVDSPDASDCGVVTVVAPGIWYHIVGTGGQFIASTCNIADYDTKISVYEGSCSNLSCVVANDDAVGPDGLDCTGFSSIATWNTSNGTDYYILVHGFNEFSVGTFNMEITCMEPCLPIPNNQTCSTAEIIALSQTDSCSYITGFNTCSNTNLNNPVCDQFGIIQDVWYTFNTGSNTSVNVDINLITATNASFAIYETCDSLEMICENDLDSLALIELIDLNENTDYLIQFWNGGSNEAGEFEICISADSIPSIGIEGIDIKNKINFFPNPATDQILIEITDLVDINLKIYDLQGMLIDERELNNSVTPIEISKWASGVYLLVFEKDGEKAHRKLMKL